MSDYYDWTPNPPLARPVVLTGFLGARLSRVGNVLSGLTGHRIVDVARGVEHRAGQSLGALAMSEGLRAVARHEAAVLAQALRVPPPPLVALGHRTLADRTLRGLVADMATLVYVQVSPQTALRRVLRDMGESEAAHYAWFAGTPPDAAALSARFEELRAGYEAADLVVSGEGPASEVASAILDALGLRAPG